MIENLHAFSYSCIRKSTHFYFRGPNNFSTFFNGAPHIRSLCANLDFSTPIRSMSMRRSIAVLKNDRKFARVFLFLHKEIDAFVFSGPEQFFNGARHMFSLCANLDFSPPIRSMSIPRSIEVLKNDRKFNFRSKIGKRIVIITMRFPIFGVIFM